MAAREKRFTTEGRKMIRRLVARGWSARTIQAALNSAGHEGRITTSLLAYYKRHPVASDKPRKNAAAAERIVCRELVLQSPNGKRGVLAVDDAGVLSWTVDAGAAQTLKTDEIGRGE